MTIRKWVYLFFTTLIIGGLSGTVAGLVIEAPNHNGMMNVLVLTIWLFGVASIFSLISQMGFLAYLMLHRFGMGLVRSVKVWHVIQVILIVVVLVDLVYLRYITFAEPGEGIGLYMIPAVILLMSGLAVAYVKQKQTSREAFVPALFVIVVVTTAEWFPVLRANDPQWIWILLCPLLLSNIWQVLILHRLTADS